MKGKRLSKEQMESLRKALAQVEVTQLQELQSYINGLVRVAITSTPEKKHG